MDSRRVDTDLEEEDEATSSVVILPDDPTNEANMLARQLSDYRQHSGIDVWGLAIYRCTYTSDTDWQAFMRILNNTVHSSLGRHGHPQLFTSLHWTVQSDRLTLDGASRDFVRKKFREWVEVQVMALKIKRSSVAESESPMDPEQVDLNIVWNQRFRFCVFVDQEVLESVIRDDAVIDGTEDLMSGGFVDLIDKDWNEDAAKVEDDGEKEDVGGYKTYEVGWMRTAIDTFIPRTYFLLGDGPFHEIYERPTAITRP